MTPYSLIPMTRRPKHIPNLHMRLAGPPGEKFHLYRWNPGPSLRARGFRGVDLWADGPVMTAGELSAYGFSPEIELRGRGATPMGPSDAARMAKRLNAYAAVSQPATGNRQPAAPRPKMTLAKLFDDFTASAAFKKLSPKTRVSYAHHLGALRKTLAPYEPRALTAELLEELHGRAAAARGAHAAWHDMKTLKTAINWGQKRDRWRGRLPDREVYSRLGLEKPRGRLRVDLDGEIDALLKAFDAPDAMYAALETPLADRVLAPRPSGGDALIVMLWTCARVHDALVMTEPAYDGQTLVYLPRKTVRTRTEPLTIPVLPVLKARLDGAILRKRAMGLAGVAELVVDEGEGAPYWTESGKTKVRAHKAFNALWRERRALAGKVCPSLVGAATDRAGRAVPAFNAADCRDVAVSRLVAAGCDLWQICAWHGSSPRDIVRLAEHYIHIGEDHAAAAGEKLKALAKAKGISA